MKTEHILIIRFSPLSDVVMTAPVVHSLATQYPDVRVTMLSCEEARPLFERMPANVGFMAADLKNEYNGVKGLNALYRRLTAKRFTAIADFHSILKSDYLRMRFNFDLFKVAHVDKHRSMRRQLTARTNKKMVPMPAVFQNYADVLERLGYPVSLSDVPACVFGSLLAEPLPAEIVATKTNGQPWIGVAPFGAYEGKTYPLPLMEQTVCMLMRNHSDANFFLFAEKDEDKKVLDEWCSRYPLCMNASSLEGGIGAGLVLMSRLDLMITMDNLFMHLASVAGTRVESVWGATHPYGGHTGWRQREDCIVQSAEACRPCSIHGRKDCINGGYACMVDIRPDRIVEKAEEILRLNG